MRSANDFGYCGHYIGALLCRNGVAVQGEYLPYDARVRQTGELPAASLPIAALATAWTMRPPSAQTASVHAVTALARLRPRA